jgi:methyltransferase-like protein/2-polyprenyl-3-methyl-5-hydroxy-6-metoxy-1,4-benzoquinol methylase
MAQTSPQKTAPQKETGDEIQKEAVVSARAYDEVPYSSYPFSQTNPILLQGIGKIFGLNAPDPRKARILEIGCAAGNNILAIAAMYPESRCVGFDYSARQIELGLNTVKELGIGNIELKHLSALDVNKDFGQFDYIICHGVLSWVPPEVQEKILEICSTNLTPDGIAYVSYNTLPGWNSVRSARDMMMYHTQRYTSAAEKAQQARLLLKFIGDSMRANNNPMSTVIDRELDILNRHPDYYLLHEHLEENNYQFYFHEFMAIADKNNLQYLAETSLEKMYSGNFSSEIAEVLATSNDIVRTEQYMDYIYDRRFRSTLLCHKDRILNRKLNSGLLMEGQLLSRFTMPEGFAAHNLENKTSLKFTAPTGMVLTTDDTFIHAMLQILSEQKNSPMKTGDLVRQVHGRLKKIAHPVAQRDEAVLADMLCQYAMRYLFIGGMYFYMYDMPFTTTIAGKPKVSELARYQARTQAWIANQRQDHLTLAPFDAVLIRHLDGNNDMDALVSLIMPHFQSKELQMNENNAVVEDMTVVEQRMPKFIQQALERYAMLGLLLS